MPPSRAAHYVVEIFHSLNRGECAIVDAGCGEGRDTLFLLKRGSHVLAIDVCDRNLRMLSRMAEAKGIVQKLLDRVMADIVQGIPIEDSSVDAILDVWLLGSVILPHDGRAGAEQYLAEVQRILKPSGLLVLEFETIRPRRSADGLRRYTARLLGERFEIKLSKAIDADYYRYIDIAHRRGSHPALLLVAEKI